MTHVLRLRSFTNWNELKHLHRLLLKNIIMYTLKF